MSLEIPVGVEKVVVSLLQRRRFVVRELSIQVQSAVALNRAYYTTQMQLQLQTLFFSFMFRHIC